MAYRRPKLHTVKGHGSHIFIVVGQILGDNSEFLSVRQRECHLRNLWSAEDIFTRSRVDRIESHS